MWKCTAHNDAPVGILLADGISNPPPSRDIRIVVWQIRHPWAKLSDDPVAKSTSQRRVMIDSGAPTSDERAKFAWRRLGSPSSVPKPGSYKDLSVASVLNLQGLAQVKPVPMPAPGAILSEAIKIVSATLHPGTT